MNFDFRLGRTFFKVRKLVSMSARSQSWLFPFGICNLLSLGAIIIPALLEEDGGGGNLAFDYRPFQNRKGSTTSRFMLSKDEIGVGLVR